MSKIVFHINSLEQGGAERVVSNLAAQFVQDGYNVLIATEWQVENEFVIDKRIKRVHVGLHPEDESAPRVLKYYKRIRYLKDFLQKEQPDLLICFAKKVNYRGLIASIRTKIPVIVSVRTTPVGHYDSKADSLLIRWLFPKAAGCVFQTEGARDFFAQGVRENSRIILNPINDKYIGRSRQGQRTREIVHVGRLVDFKNQLMLIKAFAKVHEKYPEYTLKIYGGDSHDGTKERLESCIKECKVLENVVLKGASDDLAREIENAAFFVFTSDWEGLPNAVMEAMALGLPVISTDCPCGGPGTLIEHGVNGLLIPIKDQTALEQAMLLLIENPESAEQMGNNARKIQDRANAQAIYRQWKEYAEEVIK